MRGASQRSRPIWRGSASTLASQPSASRRFARGSDAGSSQGRTATRPRPVRPLRPTGPTGSARLRTPNRRGELPASHPRSYHLLADSGDRSCFERGGLGCGRSQLRVYCPISARSGGTTSSSTASTSSTAVSCEAKGLAYKFARFWALPFTVLRVGNQPFRGRRNASARRNRRWVSDSTVPWPP